MVQTRSQRTITIQSLPRELAAHCLEFLPFAEVQPYEPKVTRSYFGSRRILDAKRVSKNFRSAARYALTRGRWRPLKLFCERGKEAILGPRINRQRGVPPPEVPEQMQALFREVWSLEPCAVLVELGSWPPMETWGTLPLPWCEGPGHYEGTEETRRAIEAALRYLDVVEPDISGYGRMLAAFAPYQHERFKPEPLSRPYFTAEFLFKAWWFRASPVDEDGDDILLYEVLSEETLAPGLRAWEIFTEDDVGLYGGVGAQVGAQFMVGQNFLWWKHRPYYSFGQLVRDYWQDRQLASTLLDVLVEYGEGYAMNVGPRAAVSIFRNREGEDPGA